MLELPAELIAGGVIISSTCTEYGTANYSYKLQN